MKQKKIESYKLKQEYVEDLEKAIDDLRKLKNNAHELLKTRALHTYVQQAKLIRHLVSAMFEEFFAIDCIFDSIEKILKLNNIDDIKEHISAMLEDADTKKLRAIAQDIIEATFLETVRVSNIERAD